MSSSSASPTCGEGGRRLQIILGYVGPPILLATCATLLSTSDSPAGVFFGHLVAYFFQLACACICFKKALGARRQYDILQQYSREGSLDCTGFVTRHSITSHRTNCIETRQTHCFEYEYRVVDEENEEEALVYKKCKEVVYYCTLCRGPGLTSLTR